MAKLSSYPEKERDAQWALAELEKAPWAMLAMADGGEPYCIPVSLARIGDKLYFHSASFGKKAELLARNPRVCISAVSYSKPFPEELTMRYRSVVAYGEAELLEEGGEEKVRALYEICRRYAPENPHITRCAEKPNAHVNLYRITLSDVTGKESNMEDGA